MQCWKSRQRRRLQTAPYFFALTCKLRSLPFEKQMGIAFGYRKRQSIFICAGHTSLLRLVLLHFLTTPLYYFCRSSSSNFEKLANPRLHIWHQSAIQDPFIQYSLYFLITAAIHAENCTEAFIKPFLSPYHRTRPNCPKGCSCEHDIRILTPKDHIYILLMDWIRRLP